MAEENKEGNPLYRLLRDALIAIVSGVVIEATLKRLESEIIEPYLRYVWSCIALFILVDALVRHRRRIKLLRDRAPAKLKPCVFPITAMVGLLLLVLVWIATGRVFNGSSIKTSYDHAHLAVVNVQLWAAPTHAEAMLTVRNIGSKPVVPCAALRGAIITSSWLNGAESEDQLFRRRPEWQEGGKGQVNCDTDWNPGVEKTYSIQLASAIAGPDDWTSLMRGEKIWYVVSRLQFRDSDTGTALPLIENCVWFRSESPEWTINRCFGHNDPTLKENTWFKGSGRAVDE